MSDEQLIKKVVFAILMENGAGILIKSPTYVLEKFHSSLDHSNPERLLDKKNTEKLRKYRERWGV